MVITAALSALLWSLSADVGAKMSSEVRSVGPNLLIAPRLDSGLSTLSGSTVTAVLSSLPKEKLAAVEAMTIGVGKIAEQSLVVVGVGLETARSLFPYWEIDGAWPANSRQVLLGKEIARKLAISVGDTVTLRSTAPGPKPECTATVTVTGVLTTGSGEEWQLFGEVEPIQTILRRADQASVLQVRLDGDGKEIAAVAKTLEAAFPDLEASPVLKIARTEATLYRTLTGTLTVVTALTVVLMLLSLSAGLAGAIFERQKEIATMKVLGASATRVWTLLMGEVVLMSAVAALLGITIGLVAAHLTEQSVFGSPMNLRWQVLPGVLLLIVAVAAAAAIPPFRRTSRLTPSIFLKGE
jgi:putative ABC transport system permease protein